MKWLKYLLIIIVIVITSFIVLDNTMSFIYINPKTNTKSLSYISNPIKYLQKGFLEAQKESKKDGLDFSYTFLNAYGSGFINNNPIPNDLDFAVGIHLGKYNYDGKNSIEIAKNLMDRINSFLYFFNIYINENEITHYYTGDMPLEALNKNAVLYPSHINAIIENLDNALKGEEYMIHSSSSVKDDQGKEITFDIPYIMNPNEILLRKFNPIKIYSDKVIYSKNMPQYLREISIVPEFCFEVTYKNKDYKIDLIPEAFTGERLHLARRFFAPNVYVSPVSDKFISDIDILNNKDSYIDHRLLSFRRHLQEILNITYVKDRPIKMFKRFMQISYIISPMMNEQESEFISNVVKKHLGNKDVQLINEYSNICGNIISILQENPRMSERLSKDKKYLIMQNLLNNIVNELTTRNHLSKETITMLNEFTHNDLDFLSNMNSREEFANIDLEKLLTNYGKLSIALSNEVYSSSNEAELKKSVQIFKNIYKKAGFSQLTLYWLDAENIGIVRNSYTKSIKDLKEFAKINNLPKVNYRFITEKQIPPACIKYCAWVRNNTTKEEDEYYKKMFEILDTERKTQKIMHKTVLIKR